MSHSVFLLVALVLSVSGPKGGASGLHIITNIHA